MASDDNISEGGSKILRHAAVDRPRGVTGMGGEALEAIDKHLNTFIGNPDYVIHEIFSEIVHIDVHIIAPSPARDCYTLVTTGTSDLPMTVPEDAEDLRFAELLLSLPKSWTPGPLWEMNFDDESRYWPIRLLASLARLPHEYGTWLGPGHTIPNGDPPAPYAPDTELCCAVILPPLTIAPGFETLRVREDKVINFYAVVPIYESEMHFKLKKGSEALIEQFFAASVTETVDPKRRVAGKKRFLFF